jgi:hypothetical protein
LWKLLNLDQSFEIKIKLTILKFVSFMNDAINEEMEERSKDSLVYELK